VQAGAGALAIIASAQRFKWFKARENRKCELVAIFMVPCFFSIAYFDHPKLILF
jgi:hypothetical protein